MILSFLCLAAIQTSTAADYFPTTPGLTRTYEHKGFGDVLVNKIGDPIEVAGVNFIPITENSGTTSGKTTYYRVESEEVTIVAYDIKHPMVKGMPVLKVGNGEIAWNFNGSTLSNSKGEPSGERLLEIGKAKPIGQRTVLGKKVDVIEVKSSATLGIGLSCVMFDQTALYAKGIGMIEVKTMQRLGNGKKSITDTYKLISIDTPK